MRIPDTDEWTRREQGPPLDGRAALPSSRSSRARSVKHLTSNAIVHRQADGQLLGRRRRHGQIAFPRVDRRCDQVAHKAARRDARTGRSLASDAFFPFPDGVEAAIDAGVAALVEPGGSVRDDEVVAACDARGVAMVFSDARHFRH